jgi:hypothetical protein
MSREGILIVSASRRTDIPAWYGDWFMNRIRAGVVLVRNPMNPRQVRRVSLRPEHVDGIVFWTKNPSPFLRHLNELDALDVPYYFQVTLTPYGPLLEPGLPPKEELVQAFLRLSSRLGSERVLWRYDPIVLCDGVDEAYHRAEFGRLASLLCSATTRCTISFMHPYRSVRTRLKHIGVREPDRRLKKTLAEDLAATASSLGIRVVSCADRELESCSRVHAGKCVDDTLLTRIGGNTVRAVEDPYQREACRCVRSVDIGEYDTCPHACLYCYGWRSVALVRKKLALHNPNGKLLIGELGDEDRVTDAQVRAVPR